MLRRIARSWRALAAVGLVLVTAASAGAALHRERPLTNLPALDQITAEAESDAASGPQILEHRLGVSDHSGVAPRVAEARQAVESGRPARWLGMPRLALPADAIERPIASDSGCAATTRWCRAHATSTQAP